jgi:hypothetical protein
MALSCIVLAEIACMRGVTEVAHVNHCDTNIWEIWHLWMHNPSTKTCKMKAFDLVVARSETRRLLNSRLWIRIEYIPGKACARAWPCSSFIEQTHHRGKKERKNKHIRVICRKTVPVRRPGFNSRFRQDLWLVMDLWSFRGPWISVEKEALFCNPALEARSQAL